MNYRNKLIEGFIKLDPLVTYYLKQISVKWAVKPFNVYNSRNYEVQNSDHWII